MPDKWQVFTPSGFQGRATNTLDALRQAKRVLKDEHRWTQGNWFHNDNPDLDPDDAYCNSWAVCGWSHRHRDHRKPLGQGLRLRRASQAHVDVR